MKKFTKVFSLAAVSMAALLTLTACGGGGGGVAAGDKPFTGPDPVPVVEVKGTLAVSTPTAVAAGQKTSPVTVTWVTTQGTNTDGRVLKADGTVVGTGANGSAVIQLAAGTSVTMNFFGPTTTLATVSVNVNCAVGTTLVGDTCTAPAVYWPPKDIAAIGVKVFNPQKLSASAVSIGDAGWQAEVKAGKVKFTDTGLILDGFSSRALKQAFYISPNAVNWCTRLVFADDGSAVGNTGTDGACSTSAVEWTMGLADGIVRFYPNLGQCYKLGWNKTTQLSTETLVTCP